MSTKMRCQLASIVLVLGIALLPLIGRGAVRAQEDAIDAAFARFWDASDPQEAAKAAEAVAKSGVKFEAALTRLKHGRTYSAQVPRGALISRHRTAMGEFWYSLDVPDTYDPKRAYQVRVQLHGGVMGRQNGAPRPTTGGALAGAEQIYVRPHAWRDAPWWSDAQIANLRAILDRLKRTYNVDENRVALAGVSDGATAAFYFAMRDTTPFASFLPLNGFIMVLGSAGLTVDGGLFPTNLLNKPLFIVNGGLDRLYPAAEVEPYVRHLERGGLTVAYWPQPDAGHNTAWWPQIRDRFEAFVAEHPRDPLPERLTWETDETAVGNRAHWLVIDKLGGSRDSALLRDLNHFVPEPLLSFGLRASGRRVTAVVAGSNADSFGLRAGDVVVKVNDRGASPGADFAELLSTFEPQTRLDILVSRDDQPVALSGVLNHPPTRSGSPLFVHPRPSGRVDIVRQGNRVHATTRGVAAFTLLVSPDAFDLTRPIEVVADGRVVFNDRVRGDVATLMRWAARDGDRSMLFGAEIHVRLAP